MNLMLEGPVLIYLEQRVFLNDMGSLLTLIAYGANSYPRIRICAQVRFLPARLSPRNQDVSPQVAAPFQ